MSRQMPLTKPPFLAENREVRVRQDLQPRRSVTPSVTAVDHDAGLIVCHCIARRDPAKLPQLGRQSWYLQATCESSVVAPRHAGSSLRFVM
jgi:hypothetical protein